ncbi:general odorant-binding protein 99a [Eupeodes corollae]|uniref:OBP18 n=1 Tax=Eupeodes corollae TaxID=290404 RepID=A0A8F9S0Q7_9MUSC|nr:general odorant-binding protein 99a [Eupeodes corollae]QYL00044.1 OBP18 [Eupeodes corollae]
MKYLAIGILFTIFAFTTAQEYKIKTQADLANIRKQCVELKKITPEQVEKYKKFEFTDDEKTRCYIECIFDKFGLFNAKDGFKIENLVKQLGQNRNQTEVRAEIQKCVDKNEQRSDSCSWVFRGFKCFISKNLPLVQQSLKAN